MERPIAPNPDENPTRPAKANPEFAANHLAQIPADEPKAKPGPMCANAQDERRSGCATRDAGRLLA
jgi:hypothetical protein